jgi:uncharacterized membrane protein
MAITTGTVLVLCFLLGGVCGLRSMAGPALVCWGVRLGWLSVFHSRLAWLAHPVALILFSLAAVSELVADKLPKIPTRILPGPLAVRMLSGALCAWALALSGQAGEIPGIVCGVVGAVTGAFGGYYLRRGITRGGVKDLPVALIEDLIAVGGGLLLISRF